MKRKIYVTEREREKVTGMPRANQEGHNNVELTGLKREKKRAALLREDEGVRRERLSSTLKIKSKVRKET